MAAYLGSLVVSLGLDATEFVQGLSKAEYQAQKAINDISKNFTDLRRNVSEIAEVVGLGFGVGEIVEWGKSVTEAGSATRPRSLQPLRPPPR